MVNAVLKRKLDGVNGQFLLDVELEIFVGDFVMIYGESGAGKTTLLRMLAGLTKPDEGFIAINQKIWNDTESNIYTKIQDRKLSYVSQNEALFPNMTVRQNLLFALDKEQDKSIVEELIDVIEMRNLQHAKPNVLSGGQKQRVALARALVRKCELLLLDEPLSALDFNMRSKLQDYILKKHQTEKITIIMVSHHISEVIKMADTVLVMQNGKIVKKGQAHHLFCEKASSALQFSGEIISIVQQEERGFVTVLIGAQQLKLEVEYQQLKKLKIGEQIIVNSNSFYIDK